MSRESVESHVLPQEHLCTICHVFMSKWSRIECVHHQGMALALRLIVNLNGDPVAITLHRGFLLSASQTRKRNNGRRLPQDMLKVELHALSSQFRHPLPLAPLTVT